MNLPQFRSAMFQHDPGAFASVVAAFCATPRLDVGPVAATRPKVSGETSIAVWEIFEAAPLKKKLTAPEIVLLLPKKLRNLRRVQNTLFALRRTKWLQHKRTGKVAHFWRESK